MNRTITVRGTGSTSAAPDLAIISLELNTQKMKYEDAMAEAAKNLELLTASLNRAGIAAESLKTTDLWINPAYERHTGPNGKTVSVFAGFSCRQKLKLTLDFQPERLNTALCAIVESSIHPEFDITFAVRDHEAVKASLLRDIAADARRRAEILCSASGVSLGELLTIDYNWGELRLESETEYRMESPSMSWMCAKASSAPDIDPEDIVVRDTAAFVWEIR